MIFSHWGFDAAYQKHGEKGKIKKQYFYNQSDPFQSTFSRQILLPMSPSAGCRDVCKMQLWDAYCLVLLFKQVEAESTVQLSSICWTERGWKTKQNQETINARSGKNLFLRFFMLWSVFLYLCGRITICHWFWAFFFLIANLLLAHCLSVWLHYWCCVMWGWQSQQSRKANLSLACGDHLRVDLCGAGRVVSF